MQLDDCACNHDRATRRPSPDPIIAFLLLSLEFPTAIPNGLPANEVQALANDWCTGNGNSMAIQPDPQLSTCYGKLVREQD